MLTSQVAIREAAAGALAGCLLIASQRDNQYRNDMFTMVYDQAQRGFKSNTPEAIHGSLLGYKELFLEGKMFMHERYTEVCDQILSFKDHRDPLVRRAVVELIPTLASYNHADFAAHYLHKTMLYLLGQLKNNRDRTTCATLFRSPLAFPGLTLIHRFFSLPRYRSRCDAGQIRNGSLPRPYPGECERGFTAARVRL